MARLLVVVEGQNDICFLKSISTILHHKNTLLSNLSAMEAIGQIVFIPIGGGTLELWSDRLQPCGIPEFHLYDREIDPETTIRRRIIAQINRRRNCIASLTRKRSLENYLHPEAILNAGNVEIQFSEFDAVPELVAQKKFQNTYPHHRWENLTRRAQKRSVNLAKRWLNTEAVNQMNVKLLADQDPNGEITNWLQTIKHLVNQDF